jgi:hypothetical protein
LTNKTLTTPTINGGTLSGAFGGNPTSITSNIFIGDLSGTSLHSGNITGGSPGSILYQSQVGRTTSLAIGSANQVLVSSGTIPQWTNTVNSATNIAGGSAGQIHYQSATGTTLFISNGTTGQVLTSNGSSVPTWGSTVTNATNVFTTTTTNASPYYLTFATNNSSGNQGLFVTGSISVNPNTNTISASTFNGTNVTTSGDITINNTNNLKLNDSSSTNSTINQDTGILKITNNASTSVNGNTIFYNKNPSNTTIEVLRLNYNNVISQKDLQVNGNINLSGNIFVNNSLLAVSTIFSNNSTSWNSDSLGVSTPSTTNYYLIASLGDFSNNSNFGSLSIKGSIGGGSGSNTINIDTTITTRGNSITPAISGLISNYSLTNSNLCDIIIYYRGTSTNTNSYGSNGSSSGAQYYIYLVTNRASGSRNIYFDLNIKGNGSSANTIFLYNPSNVTSSPTGFSVIPSLTSELNTLDNYFNTNYSDSGLTTASINLGSGSRLNSTSGTTYNYAIIDGFTNSYLFFTNPGFIPGASYQVSITCNTSSDGFNNGMYFTLESSGNTTALYTSPNLSVAYTTYLANISISRANFINIHMFLRSGASTLNNNFSISNISVKRIDTYNTGFLGIGTTTPIYNLDVNGNMASSALYLKDAINPSAPTIAMFQSSGVALFDNYNTSNQYIQFRNRDAGGNFNVRLNIFYDAVNVMNGTVFRVFNPANTTYFEVVNSSNNNTYLTNNSGNAIVLRTVSSGYIENITLTPTLTTIRGSIDVESSRTKFVGTNSGISLNYTTFNPIVEIINNYPTSNTNLNDPTAMLSMRRVGSSNLSWDAVASFTLSRYSNTSSNPCSRLDINLNGSDSTTLSPVMTFFAPSTVGGLGRVGINTTNPQYNLDVNGTVRAVNSNTSLIITPGYKGSTATNNYVTYDIQTNGTHYFWDNVEVDSNLYTKDIVMRNDHIIYGTNTSGAIEAAFWPRMSNNATVIDCGTGGFYIRSNNDTDRIYMNNDTGNVGIGTSSPTEKLHVVGNMKVGNLGLGFISITSGDTNSGYVEFKTSEGTRRGYIGHRGDTSLYLALRIENTYLGYECNGIIRAASFNATSDYRMKENVQPLSVNKTIDNLKPVEYDLSGGVHDMGFLAHEVQEEYPFLVQGEKDGTSMQSLNYNGFIALLVKEVQELKTNFRTLSLENEMLREKVKSLESKVEILENK